MHGISIIKFNCERSNSLSRRVVTSQGVRLSITVHVVINYLQQGVIMSRLLSDCAIALILRSQVET